MYTMFKNVRVCGIIPLKKKITIACIIFYMYGA